MPRKIEISHRTIIFSVLFVLGLWFVYFIRDIILQLFVALLLTTILEPLVGFLSRIKIPRSIAALISYVLFFGIFGLAISFVVPPLFDQTSSFVKALPSYLSNIGLGEALNTNITGDFLVRLSNIPGEVIKVTFSLFGNLLSIVTVLVFSFYMLVARGKLNEGLGAFFGEEKKKELDVVIGKLEKRLGGWSRGELFLMIAVGVLTYIGLLILKIPFALPLAIFAGVLEIVPLLGPILAAIPSLIIGFGISPAAGIGTIIVAFAVQQLENYVLVPKIMEKSVGVSPIVTLIALIIGGKIAGIVGIIISVPMVITIQVLLKEYLVKN